MNGVSVIVCCYNSAVRLPLVLRYLSLQKQTADIAWEIIVVDNNSTDNTAAVAEQLWSSFDNTIPIQIIHETKPGLSFARGAGVNAALHDIIIFCDDDNLLTANYVQYAYDLVHTTKKEGFGIWGGKPVEYFDNNTAIPEWFENEKANYVVGSQGASTGDISNRGYVWGAGMIILKHLFLKITDNKFPLLLTGRKSNILSAGDDSEICARSLILGYKLYYDETLILKHYIPENKLTKEYNLRLIQGFKHANPLLNKYNLFVHYISNSNFLQRLYYSIAYSVKYLLSILQVRTLTEHDTMVIHALFQTQFNDSDFGLMRELLKQRIKHSA